MEKKTVGAALVFGILIGVGGTKEFAPIDPASAATVMLNFQNEHTWVASHDSDGGTTYGHRECWLGFVDGGSPFDVPCSEVVLTSAQAAAFQAFADLTADAGGK